MPSARFWHAILRRLIPNLKRRLKPEPYTNQRTKRLLTGWDANAARAFVPKSIANATTRVSNAAGAVVA